MSGITWLSDILTALNAFSGASLGASFYVLIKTQPYLSNRSYDPKFNAAYISRFITGLIGGVILAIALGPFLTEKLEAVAGSTLTPGVLAILGGFSAEAVELILQRLVEILLAAIRGDGSGDVKAKVTLRDELRRRKEPLEEATLLGWLGPVADALAVVHAEHCYRRDIAPDNVLLLTGSNRSLLLDFGAA